MAKKVTIKDIADMAGVSIATVSHVINRTRYVSPDLVEKIENIIIETGYHKKIEEKERRLKVGRQSEIVAVIPNVESTIYRDMVGYLKKYVSIQGYQFYIAITDNDIKEEAQVLEGLIQNKKTAGIIHVPVSDVAADYKKLIESGIPFVCMERNILGDGIDSVEFRDREAIFKGTDYLLECGHKNILFLSDDGITWTKDIANPVITPMTELYEKLDWRDPYVFYNEEDENYWILISARRLDMPVTRRGCIVLYRSKNLKDWTYYGPIYSPGHTNCPECPEMYKMGGHWYLSYSRFSEFVNTIYRVSESPFGPWRKPKKDGIGGRRFYAAKSMQNDDGRRFYFGWAHDRAEQSDKGEWYWGGTFCIPHEVVPTENGELNVKLPCEYEHIFDKAVNWKYISVLGNAKNYGEKTITLNALESCSYGFLRHTEESYMLTCKIVPRETYDTFGILLKSDKEASGCLFLEFDKAMQRVSFLNLPMGVDPFWVQSCQAVPPATEPGPDGVRVCEKTMQIEDGRAIDVKIIVDHDMIEAFIDEQIAFTYRIYAKPEFETGIIAQDSNVEFYNLSISGK